MVNQNQPLAATQGNRHLFIVIGSARPKKQLQRPGPNSEKIWTFERIFEGHVTYKWPYKI